jgi:xanthine/uracil/vitamin C permease (AzgA family)
MALVITGTFGLVVWIVLWALNVSGFDALLIGIVLVLVVTAIRNVAVQLSRKDQ